MKELSIEEKARRYDEALKVIKGCNPDENGFITIYPQEIFPELKVSDDERICNGLIKLLNCIAPSEYENTFGITKEEALEWVKRQGEDKSIPCSDGIVDNSLEGIINAAIYWGKEAPTENGRILEDKVKGAVDYYCSLIRNNNRWSVKDLTRFNDVIRIIEGSDNVASIKNHYVDFLKSIMQRSILPSTWKPSDEQVNTLMKAMADVGYEWDAEKKELKKIEQKPTEDVDLPEFESYLCLMFQKFRTKGMCTNGEIIDYVKEHSQKLRDILVKPTWNEEDERNASYICAALDCYYRLREDRNNTNGQEDLDKARNWLYNKLKSISPQTKWKPSEGQLECLGYAIEKAEKDWSPLINNRIYLTLKALKEQLKKLKE